MKLEKKIFLTTHVSCCISGELPSWQLTPECDLTDTRVMVDFLPVRSHSGIDTFCLP